VDARREVVYGLTNDEVRRCLELLVSGAYPSGWRHEVSVLHLRVEETSHGGAREVLLDHLEASDARSGLPPHTAVPHLLLEFWAEFEKVRSLYYYTLRLEHDGGTCYQRMEEMHERVRPVTTKAYRAAMLLYADFHENEQREREETRRHAEEAKRRALDSLATLGLNVSLGPVGNKERDESLLEENGPTLTEDDVQFVRRLSQSLVASLTHDGKNDAEAVQSVRQRVVEWLEQEEPDEEESRAIQARRGS
jgi:hypothetical protein